MGVEIKRLGAEARSLRTLVRAGALRLDQPWKAPHLARSLRDYGSFGAVAAVGAIQYPDRVALRDDRGSLTYRQMDDQVNRLANALALQYAAGQSIGILCRNHRVPLIAAFAAARSGLNAVWLNTGFSTVQATEVAAREGLAAIIVDADLMPAVAETGMPLVVVDMDQATDGLDLLLAEAPATPPPAPAHIGHLVLMTSGTTGTPKGAPRPQPKGFTIAGGVLERMPMRSGGTTLVAPPLFHGTGLFMALLSLSLGSTVVLRRKFEAADLLDTVEQYAVDTVCVVPTMLQRVLTLEETRSRDTSSLKFVFSGGAALPADTSRRFQERYGKVLYNLYGATEVSVATLATPDVVHEHPTSVGRATLGVRLEILDDNGKRLPSGETGRIFVGTTSPFQGYTGGGSKEVIDGMISTGDVGFLDPTGLLFLAGRDDDMIVSGGENVFPGEVEELLASHPAVAEVSVLGVPDEEFGARLRAFVVLNHAAELTVADVQDYARQNLARFKVPRDVVFIPELPRNPTGKVLKRVLATWE